MNEQDQVIAGIAKRMQDIIEEKTGFQQEVADLISRGWVYTGIRAPSLVEQSDWSSATGEWIHKNAKGDYKLIAGRWLFELDTDAMLFILRWS